MGIHGTVEIGQSDKTEREGGHQFLAVIFFQSDATYLFIMLNPPNLIVPPLSKNTREGCKEGGGRKEGKGGGGGGRREEGRGNGREMEGEGKGGRREEGRGRERGRAEGRKEGGCWNIPLSSDLKHASSIMLLSW